MGHTLQIAPATPPTVCCSAGAGADSRSARLGLAEWVCESSAVASHEEDSKQHCQDDGAHAHRLQLAPGIVKQQLLPGGR